ncbi:hypothetical protein [Oligoflexus tunisiensis]|uniref:hypothetical protein n=1 Tax=Oligoflexus tunisiensis TaxID=708132 RepID=UPI00114CA5E8|nr:hypothetical protein [Oligoflexus tunisiensis]
MRIGFLRMHHIFMVSTLIVASCTQYKPSGGRFGKTTTGPGSAINSNVPLVDVSVVIANTKLAVLGGNLTAKVTYNDQSATQPFTPTGTQSELKGIKLPAGTAGVMKVEILQNDSIKFVAKRANTSVQSGGSVVIDDCLILRAPWAGTVNEGSCEWNITEVTN